MLLGGVSDKKTAFQYAMFLLSRAILRQFAKSLVLKTTYITIYGKILAKIKARLSFIVADICSLILEYY